MTTTPIIPDTEDSGHNALAPITVDLLREIVGLKADLGTCQDLLKESISMLAELTAKHRRQSERLFALLDERREQQKSRAA